MQKRYCDICGRTITDKYMFVNTERRKEYPFESFQAGEGCTFHREMCLDCYEKFREMFCDFEKQQQTEGSDRT